MLHFFEFFQNGFSLLDILLFEPVSIDTDWPADSNISQ